MTSASQPSSSSPPSQTSELILDLDQHLHRQALLESIQFLQTCSQFPTSSRADLLNLIDQSLLRLTYLALHCRTDSSIRSEIRSLHRQCQHRLALTLERQQSPG